ncbi:unnamed protein product, partial [Ixodes hexagonus]
RSSFISVGETILREISNITTVIPKRGRAFSMLVLGSVVFLTAIVMLLLLLFVRPSSEPIGTCISELCTQAQLQMNELVDYAVNPCRDIYRHICHKRWGMDPGGRHQNGFLQDIFQDVLLSVSSNLHKSRPLEDDTTGLHTFARFYKMCYQFMSSTRPSLRDILKPLAVNSGILHLTSFSLVLDWLVRMSLTHGIDILFGVSMKRNVTHAYLHLSQGKSLAQKLGSASHSNTTLAYLKSVLDEVTHLDPSANTSFNYLVSLDSALASHLRQRSSHDEYKLSNLGSINRHLTSEEWLRAINDVLPRRAVKLNLESVLIAEGLRSISDITRTFEDLADFGLVYILVHVLTLTARLDYTRRIVAARPMTITEICLKESQSLFVRTWAEYFQAIMGRYQPSTRATTSIFRLIRREASEEHRLAKMDDATKVKAAKLLKTLNLQLYPLSPSGSDKLYENRSRSVDSWDDFASAYLELSIAERKHAIVDPLYQSDELKNKLLLEGRVVYSAGLHSIAVPAAMDREPVTYPEEVPLEFNLGTLGVLMAKETSRALSSPHLDSESVSSELEVFLKCIRSLADTFNFTLDADGREIYLWARGARLAYDTLKRELNVHSSAPNWDRYWEIAQMTFFRRFCLLSCGSREAQQQLSGRARCILPLANMAEFASVFKCSSESPMRKVNQCGIV